MIFGVLNPEKIWHQQLVHLSFFHSIIHSYFRLLMLSQKKTNCYIITHYIWKMSPHYLVKVAEILHLFHFFTCIEYQFAIRTSCGTTASLLRHGLNFSRAWWMIQLISGKKDWKHVSMQKVVTLNICCNVACLTFHLTHITTSSFQSHHCQPTTGSFQIHQHSEKCTYLQSDENVVHFTR